MFSHSRILESNPSIHITLPRMKNDMHLLDRKKVLCDWAQHVSLVRHEARLFKVVIMTAQTGSLVWE